MISDWIGLIPKSWYIVAWSFGCHEGFGGYFQVWFITPCGPYSVWVRVFENLVWGADRKTCARYIESQLSRHLKEVDECLTKNPY